MEIKICSTRKLCVLLLCFVFISLAMIPVKAEDDAEETEGGDEEEQPPQPCQKQLISLVRKFLLSALQCLGGRLPLRSPFDLAKRFYCVIKCVLSVEGILNEEGVLDEVAALFYFQENIPKSILDTLVGGAQPCLELAKDFNPKEYYCQSYAPFTQCSLPVFANSLGPYALDCFGTPAFGFLFGLINAIVPRAEPPNTEANSEIRKRLTAATKAYKLRKNNGTTVLPNGNTVKRRAMSNNTIRYPIQRNVFNYNNNYGNNRRMY